MPTGSRQMNCISIYNVVDSPSRRSRDLKAGDDACCTHPIDLPSSSPHALLTSHMKDYDGQNSHNTHVGPP